MFLTISSLEPQDGHLFDDFSLFDSILPNIFPSTPFLDIEPQEILTAEVPGLMAVSYTHLRAHETDS